MKQCWAPRALRDLEGAAREIAGMYLEGPEALEYLHEDVWRAMGALGVEVTLEDVKDHRTGRCPCRKGNA